MLFAEMGWPESFAICVSALAGAWLLRELVRGN